MLAGLLALLPCFSWADGDPFLGEIRWVAFERTPLHWAPCSGQLLNIAHNSALYSLLGTSFGGNGWSTFALPDMRGRAPLHVAGSANLGDKGGAETHTLTLAELPPHTHMVQVDGREATQADPGGAAFLAKTSAGTSAYGQTPNTHLATESVSFEGAGQPHTNMKPFIALNCIIALQGVFPPRD
jgi:microcystin-dependent protein